MKLIDYIRELLLVATVSARHISGTTGVVDVTVNPDNFYLPEDQKKFVAPYDGFFSIVMDDANGANYEYISVKLHVPGVETSSAANKSALSISSFIPVQKGESVTVNTRGSYRVWWAHFVPYLKQMGGG